LPPAATAVGTVYALHAIAEGVDLNHAVGKLAVADEQVIAAIRAVYASRVGNEEKAQPSEDQRSDAQTELFGLHLRGDHFWQR
jgi:hypothetical protein